MNTLKLTRYAMVIALTVCLNLVLGAISFGAIQIRVSELLLLLCLFDSSYTWPLTLGCLLSNTFGMMLGFDVLPLDFIFGTLATLLSCSLMVSFKNLKIFRRPIVSLLMPAIINGLVVGSELALYFGGNQLIKYFVLYGFYVFLGEFVVCTILGFVIYEPFEKYYQKLIKC